MNTPVPPPPLPPLPGNRDPLPAKPLSGFVLAVLFGGAILMIILEAALSIFIVTARTAGQENTPQMLGYKMGYFLSGLLLPIIIAFCISAIGSRPWFHRLVIALFCVSTLFAALKIPTAFKLFMSALSAG